MRSRSGQFLVYIIELRVNTYCFKEISCSKLKKIQFLMVSNSIKTELLTELTQLICEPLRNIKMEITEADVINNVWKHMLYNHSVTGLLIQDCGVRTKTTVCTFPYYITSEPVTTT